MFKRILSALLILLCLFSSARAGGKGKDAHLVSQQGEYDPRYSVKTTFEVLPGKEFSLVLYEDSGTLALTGSRNSGNIPSGSGVVGHVNSDGVRQLRLTGLLYAEGEYSFSVLVQEPSNEEGEGKIPMRTLAILHVTLRVTSDIPVVEPYLGDGQGMLRLVMDGVNLRRTPDGTRLAQYDEGTRMVWCSTEKKGGHTWYRVWTEDFGYACIRSDMAQEEPPLRLVYTPGKETAFTLFITPGTEEVLVPSLIMTESPGDIGFDTEPLVTVHRGDSTWTLLCFSIEEEKTFWIQCDLRDESGAPLECQLIYLTTQWEEVPAYVNN